MREQARLIPHRIHRIRRFLRRFGDDLDAETLDSTHER
jgi:hypothetical protein